MILRITYKDPDYSMRDVKTKKEYYIEDLEDQGLVDRLDQLGIGEYLTIEVDTDTGHTRVVP